MKWLYSLTLGAIGGVAVGSLLGVKPLETLRGFASKLTGDRGAATAPSASRRDPLGGMMADERVTRAVRERLAERSIAARRVDVTTVDGVVYLRGRVEDSAERSAVVGVAQDTPGAASVVDELKLPEAAT